MKKLYLIGGGGHCKSCIDVIEQQGEFEIKGIFDLEENLGKNVLNYQIIDIDNNLEKYVDDENYFLITIGYIKTPKLREELFQKLLKTNANIATVISPRAYVSRYAKVGVGTIIMHDALINANVDIGRNCIINSKALLEHDVLVEDNCHISTASVLNGGVTIEKNSFIGSNSTVIQGVNILANSFIKAGSLIK